MNRGTTWPASSEAVRFTALPLSKPHKRRRNPTLAAPPHPPQAPAFDSGCRKRDPSLGFSALPFDILVRVSAPFAVPDLWAASLVCRAWRDGLRPLREAMTLLHWGKRFKHGRGGVRANRDKALESFLKGVVRGSTAAMVDAGLLYWEMGKKEEAVRLYQKAAELGDPSGQCNLGISYLQADPPKLEEAVKLFHQGASAGHVRAQYNLALCLHQGRGVECNLHKAARWYLKAAEGGNERAMYNTFLCYSLGEGFLRDDQQAKKWLRRAADRGHHKAQYEHGLRLFTAGEVQRALVYLELATRAGEAAAAHVRDAASQMISPSSREWAMSTANKWQQLPSR